MPQTWRKDYHIEIAANAETIWAIFRDVSRWKEWNAGIEQIDLEGPFANDTWFTMKPPGQEALRSRLIDVRENEGFVDETRVDDLSVLVAHRIESLGPHRSRVTYSVEATGPGASEIGPMVSSDFPDVLSSLAARAEARQS